MLIRADVPIHVSMKNPRVSASSAVNFVLVAADDCAGSFASFVVFLWLTLQPRPVIRGLLMRWHANTELADGTPRDRPG